MQLLSLNKIIHSSVLEFLPIPTQCHHILYTPFVNDIMVQSGIEKPGSGSSFSECSILGISKYLPFVRPYIGLERKLNKHNKRFIQKWLNNKLRQGKKSKVRY